MQLCSAENLRIGDEVDLSLFPEIHHPWARHKLVLVVDVVPYPRMGIVNVHFEAPTVSQFTVWTFPPTELMSIKTRE